MKLLSLGRIAAGFSMTLTALPAVGQTPSAPACDPVGSVSGRFAKAQLMMDRANADAQASRSAMSDLQEVARALVDDKTGNPLARNYLLGQAYMLFLSQPGIGFMPPRSALGLTINGTEPINLLAGADSAFRIVEQLAPECAPLVAELRGRTPGIRTILGATVDALNAGNYDSAEVFANRVLLVERNSPYPYYVLGMVARKRGDLPGASQNWQKALAAAASDSLYAAIKANTLHLLAVTATDRAQAASGPEKTTLTREAIKAWSDVLNQANQDTESAESLSRIAAMYSAIGDTAAIPAMYAPLLKSPSSYGEYSLIAAGVAAFNAKRFADATSLLEAAAAVNPYSRDALRNLIITYVSAHQYDKVIPYANKLMALEPSTPDYAMFNAIAYQGLAKTVTKDKVRFKTYADSLTYFNTLAENAKTKLTVNEFVRGEAETSLGGTIENSSAAPKTYTLSVDFLDKAGNVVGSQTAQVGPVAPKASQSFRVQLPKGGVYGFRYKPL